MTRPSVRSFVQKPTQIVNQLLIDCFVPERKFEYADCGEHDSEGNGKKEHDGNAFPGIPNGILIKTKNGFGIPFRRTILKSKFSLCSQLKSRAPELTPSHRRRHSAWQQANKNKEINGKTFSTNADFLHYGASLIYAEKIQNLRDQICIFIC